MVCGPAPRYSISGLSREIGAILFLARTTSQPMWVGTARGSKAPGDGEPVRRHTRVLFSVPIALHHLVAGGIRTSRGVSLDISESGIGALVEGALHVGDAVSIDINLPAAKLRAVAIVPSHLERPLRIRVSGTGLGRA